MVDEPHAVVKLLLARMESHPEEFERGMHRWSNTIGDITEWGNETDKAAINAKLRDIRLREAHEDAMDELCNGPERRRMQQEEVEYERQMTLRNTTQPAYAQSLQQQLDAMKYAAQTQTFTPGIRGKSLTQAVWDEYANTNQLSKGTLSSDMDPLAGSTYTSPFDSIKQALGIKK